MNWCWALWHLGMWLAVTNCGLPGILRITPRQTCQVSMFVLKAWPLKIWHQVVYFESRPQSRIFVQIPFNLKRIIFIVAGQRWSPWSFPFPAMSPQMASPLNKVTRNRCASEKNVAWRFFLGHKRKFQVSEVENCCMSRVWVRRFQKCSIFFLKCASCACKRECPDYSAQFHPQTTSVNVSGQQDFNAFFSRLILVDSFILIR